MNGGPGRFGSPTGGLSDSPLEPHTSKPKTNRLSRSLRQTQAAEVDSPRRQQSDFKSPTRTCSSRAAPGFNAESPHNDSDVQQDIIWDANSPPPHRLGKRGKKHSAGVVDISEIVSRIAPKVRNTPGGMNRTSELGKIIKLMLLFLKHGRPRVTEPTLQQWIGDSATIPCTPDLRPPKPKKKSPRLNAVDDLLKLAKQFDFNMFRQDEDEEEEKELLTEDVFKSNGVNDFSLPGNGRLAVGAVGGANMRPHLDQHMEDDLDLLFDGPTQHLSGSFSQASQVKPSASSRGPTAAVSTTTTAPANDEFDDDWENDDLLNDCLVLEMTQNTQKFTTPQLCSTQKPKVKGRQSPAPVGPRMTFRLESNPDFPVKRIQLDSSSETNKGPQQNRVSGRTGSQSDPVKPDHQNRPVHHRTSNMTHSFSQNPEGSAHLDDDLDLLFSSDPVWDDPADDDLLCEVCEDLENQMQGGNHLSTKQAAPPARVSSWQPTTRTRDLRFQQQQQAAAPRGSGAPGGLSLVGQVNAAKEPFKFTQTKSVASVRSTCQQEGSEPRPTQQRANRAGFSFKRPQHPVSTVTSTVGEKCSSAQIELKKQQAMEKRRRRLQDVQNL
ncbi:ewing's tumor-associated antigen 1 isoform X1 [Brachyistius frenatus]|uniref:ewing's tumor-associated antigen 1 isoform X1 n=1 Tax=Brachyistius frenatus TaxID=100188 RepID=UPI0037E95D7E